jgi:hypothetical protein
VVAAIAKIDENFKGPRPANAPTEFTPAPGLFQYNLYRDSGRTGRLEVTLFKDSKDDQDESGILIHSKLETNAFPEKDIEGFLKKIEDHIEK